MKFQSKLHEIEAFKFEGCDTKAPEWFIKAYEQGEAFITLGEVKKARPSITVMTKMGRHKAFLGDWVCKNKSNTLFVLSNEELERGFVKIS